MQDLWKNTYREKEMKTLEEYINESIRLDEVKKVKVDDIIEGLNKIDKWNNMNNIKKLISSYMSAGDVEEYNKDYWNCCAMVVSEVSAYIRKFISEVGVDVIDLDNLALTDKVADAIEDYLLDMIDKEYKDDDWDIDACINLFNTVSMKLCKEAWLI